MATAAPETPEQLAEALRCSAEGARTIALAGNGSKAGMGGPVRTADSSICTGRLRRVLQYEPHDLTISVEAGITFAELSRTLAANRQMIPLDPPFADSATIGGILAANTSGPRRRLYGTARDLVIGMTFATVEGKLVQSGGMVVKNVAGLDTAKLMIGSFGTLAVIAVANFKVAPLPERTLTLAFPHSSLAEAMERRNRVLGSALQPAAVDLLNPAAAGRIGRRGWLLLVQGAGSRTVVERYSAELAGEPVGDEAEAALWDAVREFTPLYMSEYPEGAVVRVSSTLTGLAQVMTSLTDAPAVARAGTGVCYAHFPDAASAASWMERNSNFRAVVEFAPARARETLDLWPRPGPDFDLMKSIKRMFDPASLLNPGRLYGRI